MFSSQFSRLWHSVNLLQSPAVAFYDADYNGTLKLKPVSSYDRRLTVLAPKARNVSRSSLFPETALSATDASTCLLQGACTQSLSFDTLSPGGLLVNSFDPGMISVPPSPPCTPPLAVLTVAPATVIPPPARTLRSWRTWHFRTVRPWARTSSTP